MLAGSVAWFCVICQYRQDARRGFHDSSPSIVLQGKARFTPVASEAGCYMRAIMASPKAEQDTSVAPSIRRAKS